MDKRDTHLGALVRSQINGLDPMPSRGHEHVAARQGRDVEEGDHIWGREDDVGWWEGRFGVECVGGEC